MTDEQIKEKHRLYQQRYYQRPDIKEKQRLYQQRPEYKEKHRLYQQRVRYGISLIDIFTNKDEKLTLKDIRARTGMSLRDILFSLSQSLKNDSIIREGEHYRINPLFAPCVDGVYEDWKLKMCKGGRRWESTE